MRRVWLGSGVGIALTIALLGALAAPAQALDVPGLPDRPRSAPSSAAPVLASSIDLPDFRPLAPARLADTRAGGTTVDGVNSGGGPVTPSSPLEVVVTGRGGVAATGVTAVALNVTVTAATSAGYVTVYPAGAERPLASSLNYGRNQTIANTVMASVGTGGRVAVYSSGTAAHLVVDVSGYFTVGGGYTALTPARIADSRVGASTADGLFAGTGPLSPSKPLEVQVTGRGGVDTSGVTAVALNVTVTASSTNGYFTVYPTGSTRPTASNLNFAAGQTVANSVVAKVGTGGRVTVYGSAAASHAVVDVVGFFSGAGYVPLVPERFSDTRNTPTTLAGPWFAPDRDSFAVGDIGTASANGSQIDILIAGRGGVPLTDVGAVVLNVTVASATGPGYLTVFPLDTIQPLASNLNFAGSAPVPNMVVAKVGRGGGVSIYSAAPRSHLVVDVLGYFPGVSTADVSGKYASIATDEVGMPVSYDRCYPIGYKINPAGAPEGWIADVETALDHLSAATGIEFVDHGPTTEEPALPRTWSDHMLIAFTDEAQLPNLAGSVVGVGGSVYGGTGSYVRWVPSQFWYGFAYFDKDAGLPAGFGTGSTFGKVALHEIAHAVGLGHVENEDEIMNWYVISRPGSFGTGDLAGLSLLYHTQGCPGSPATYGALRAGVGKPMPAGMETTTVYSAH